ncbi:MAG: hypothetical protein GF334_11075 [Candidatus Altiarchaeales archaeon]|nr:hypothetical protein [Candidatus Altiarchaeales archaeon]
MQEKDKALRRRKVMETYYAKTRGKLSAHRLAEKKRLRRVWEEKRISRRKAVDRLREKTVRKLQDL